MLVSDIMTQNPITVTGGMGIIEAARLLLENRINGLSPRCSRFWTATSTSAP